MENIVLGLLAHVDRGKTSLSEALLYESGRISEKGRVDHGDSVLDKDSLERKKELRFMRKAFILPRKISVFSFGYSRTSGVFLGDGALSCGYGLWYPAD